MLRPYGAMMPRAPRRVAWLVVMPDAIDDFLPPCYACSRRHFLSYVIISLFFFYDYRRRLQPPCHVHVGNSTSLRHDYAVFAARCYAAMMIAADTPRC